jgi:hypothetical protein
VLAGGASLFIGNAYQAQLPAFASDLGHMHSDFSYSALLAADAAGALLAGLLLESRIRRTRLLGHGPDPGADQRTAGDPRPRHRAVQQ